MEGDFSGWAQFWGDARNFSEGFREQMSHQLFVTFYHVLGIKDKSKMRFLLQVGLTDMQTFVKDEYAFGLVTIISPTAQAKTITAYWKRQNKENPLNAISDVSLSPSTIEFGFCSDFDKDFFLAFVKPKKQLSRKKNNLNFTVEYDYALYPDLSMTISTEAALDEETPKMIHEVLNQQLSGAYVSELEGKVNQYHGIFDFHDIPYEKGITQLVLALQELSKLQISSTIKKITIE